MKRPHDIPNDDEIVALYIERKLNVATAWGVFVRSTTGMKPSDQLHTLGRNSYTTNRWLEWSKGSRPTPRPVARAMRQQMIQWAIDKYSGQPQLLVEMLS